MATQNGGRVFRDKQVSAVMSNMKEQRVLEKSLQTLQLEQSYAIRLLELDNRVLKVKYKKLKEKVSKIKSYLPAEDISKFRELDQQGKLKPSYGDVSLGSALKIAAAARRLNLNTPKHSGRRAIRSALPRITLQGDPEVKVKTNQLNFDPIKRSNSVTGVFIDVPLDNDKPVRPGSASVIQGTTGTRLNWVPQGTGTTQGTGEGTRRSGVKTEKDVASPKMRRNVTLLEDGFGESAGRVLLPVRALSALPHAHTQFSSHTSAEKDARLGLSTAPAQYSKSRRLSHISNDSIDSNLGENMFEERRQELLEEENIRSASLQRRTQLFLRNVDDFLQKIPPSQQTYYPSEEDSHSSKSRVESKHELTPHGGEDWKQKYHRRKNVGEEFDDTPTYLPENNYKDRLMGLWKDMNKCRYLRLPDEKIDLSGINTLVKDQMKMFESIKQGDRIPLRAAWEN